MITREDVARLAGVSVSAVSRTMNNRGYVAKEKKDAIFKAAKDLGYRQGFQGSFESRKHTFQLCFFCPDIYNSFCVELFIYMSEYALERGYTLFLFSHSQLERIRNMAMDGMILANESMANDIHELFGSSFPFPVVSASYGLPVVKTKGIPYVDSDTYDVTEIGLRYLFSKGHKRIAFATPFDFSSEALHPRHICFANYMKSLLGSHFDDYIIARSPEKSVPSLFEKGNYFEAGMYGADHFIAKGCDATAVMCFNDEYAMGMMKRFEQLGYRIPDAVSVLGIDGTERRKYMTPLLTSVSLNMKKQGICCVQTLLDMIENRKVSFFTSIEPYMAEGDSVRSLP